MSRVRIVSIAWQVLIVSHAITAMAVIVAVLISLPLGFYVAYNHPILLLLLSIYMILVVILVLKPRDVLRVSLSIHKGESVNDNNMLVTVSCFSILVTASMLIDTMQSYIGISMGSLEALYESDIAYLIDASIAPLREELAFRVILIGLPLYLLAGNGRVSTLWHPYTSGIKGSKVTIFVVISSFIFSISHLLFGAGWEYGKLSQAMVGGLILGWVYYRYGLVPAIVLHWLTNHLLLTYSIYSDMGSIITNDVLTSLTILVVANGVLSLLVYLRSIMADP